MTLVVAVTGPESIWLLADRRLSYPRRPPKDDGCKVMVLDTTDGVAILGYAGLGATTLGNEPADWMSAVLRGRNLPLEQSLGILAKAMQEQLPRHMISMPGSGGPAHHVIVPAFLNNEPRLYSIDLVFAPDRKNYKFRFTRHVANTPTASLKTPRLYLSGSGSLYLKENKKWMRSLLSVVKANDRGKISPRAVANYLASANNNVHLGMTDKSVGPRCIVAWRFRKGGVHNVGGGHRLYTGLTPETSSPALPSIACGMDLKFIGNAFMDSMMKRLKVTPEDEFLNPLINLDEVKAKLTSLPDKPDEKLR